MLMKNKMTNQIPLMPVKSNFLVACEKGTGFDKLQGKSMRRQKNLYVHRNCPSIKAYPIVRTMTNNV
jgi:hypothetical protein